MDYKTIAKGPLDSFPVKPNLSDYLAMRQTFRWEDISAELDWFDGDHINIGHIATDAHLKTDRRDKPALIWESQKGEVERYTFADLSRLSNKFANVLTKEIGIQKGDRVFFFLERVPEIFIGILGTLKAGAVIGPLFSAFGPDAVKDRMADSRARVLVTSPMLKKKIEEILPDLPHLEKIIVVNRRN
ncbi:MAG: AMP-binding protein, partial [Chloroflexi bacterium]|nr:AMP-binding protein [Chloroflexota bacterium]